MAILVGLIGLLGGGLFVQTSRANKYKTKAKENEASAKAQEEIAEIINKPNKRKSTKGKTIKHLIILIASSYIIFGCSVYSPNAPKLFLVDKPNDFRDIEHTTLDNGTYLFTADDLDELLRQFDWCGNAVDKYEEQIKAYNAFREKTIDK